MNCHSRHRRHSDNDDRCRHIFFQRFIPLWLRVTRSVFTSWQIKALIILFFHKLQLLSAHWRDFDLTSKGHVRFPLAFLFFLNTLLISRALLMTFLFAVDEVIV